MPLLPPSLPSLRSLSTFALSSTSFLSGTAEQIPFGNAQAPLVGQAPVGARQACSHPQLSCHNTTVVENLCCFNYPGGQMLQTQFWDTHPPTGPEDSWTIHGLWPDRCDGTYEANCDSHRTYTNITSILLAFNKSTLVDTMSTYWKDNNGHDATLWQHEWSKHGTCISTLEPKCYLQDSYVPTQEVADYFDRAVSLFTDLPSFTWLADAGITPSTTQTYTFEQIQDALGKNRGGVSVTLGCKNGALNEIWYHYNMRGSVQDGEFVPAEPDGTKSSCPAQGIRYLPKSRRGGGGGGGGGNGDGAPFQGKGNLRVYVDGKPHGCLISRGEWYASWTCAVFTAKPLPSSSASSTASEDDPRPFTLSTSKGPCGIHAGAFVCGRNVIRTATGFTHQNETLAVGGNAAFSADKVARGWGKVRVWAGGEHREVLRVRWEGV